MKNSNEKLNAIIREGNQRLKAIEEIKTVFDNLVDSAKEFSSEVREEKRNSRKSLVDYLKKNLAEKTDSERLTFLFQIKEHYLNLMDQAKINEDNYQLKNFQEELTQIINPKISFYKDKINSKDLISNSESKTEIPVELDESKHKELKFYALPNGFSQISCSASKEEIMDYFMILTKEKNNSKGEQFMSKKDVQELVENNFKIFKKASTGRVFEINIKKRQKSILTYFVYQFYERYAAKEGYDKKDYVNFLLWNFVNYKTDNIKSLASNMTASNAPTAKNIIQIKPYLG